MCTAWVGREGHEDHVARLDDPVRQVHSAAVLAARRPSRGWCVATVNTRKAKAS